MIDWIIGIASGIVAMIGILASLVNLVGNRGQRFLSQMEESRKFELNEDLLSDIRKLHEQENRKLLDEVASNLDHTPEGLEDIVMEVKKALKKQDGDQD